MSSLQKGGTAKAHIARNKMGHKHNCNCVICNNMKKKNSRGGYEEDFKKDIGTFSHKTNGHKDNCNCPICKNMNKTKSNNNSTKKNGHKLNCQCPICKNMNKSKKSKSS